MTSTPPASRLPRKTALILIVAALSLVALAWTGFGIKIKTKPPMLDGTPEQKAAAEGVALGFLAVIDTGDYARTWDAASRSLQREYSKARWELTLRATRKLLGANKERHHATTGFTRSLGDGTPGEFCGVVYESTFATTTLLEQVDLHFDEGRWKVMGYHVRNTVVRR